MSSANAPAVAPAGTDPTRAAHLRRSRHMSVRYGWGCPACGGTGHFWHGDEGVSRCPDCAGRGVIRRRNPAPAPDPQRNVSRLQTIRQQLDRTP